MQIKSLVTGLVLGAAVATAGTAGAAELAGPQVPHTMTKACVTEDSVNCYWNASQRGNGHGHSYIVREFPGSTHMVCVMYVNRRYARRHDYCS